METQKGTYPARPGRAPRAAPPGPPRPGCLPDISSPGFARPGLQAWGCSPGACLPGASSSEGPPPGPPYPGLHAPGLLARGSSPRDSLTRAACPGPPRPGLLPGALGPGLLAWGLQARGCSHGASRPGAARYGSLLLKPFLYLREGLTQAQTPARLWVPCSETPGEVRRDRMHKMDSAPLAPGLHARGCILPWLLRAEASLCTRQKRVSVSHTASRPGGLN